MKKPKKPIRKEYWAGESVENDEKRYTGGLKQYADKAEKYIEHIEKKVNGNSTSDKTALNLDFVVGQSVQFICPKCKSEWGVVNAVCFECEHEKDISN